MSGRPGACAVCGNTTGNEAVVAREMMFGRREAFAYVVCARCGCVGLAEPPADLAPYYPRGYYAYAGPEARRGPLRRLVRRSWITHALGRPSLLGPLLARVMPPNPIAPALRAVGQAGVGWNDAILDVGSGAGRLLLLLQTAGFTDLTGVDPYVERDLDYGGARVRKASLFDVDGAFDLVMFHHAFEHMPEPAAVLAKAAALTRPGRFVVLRIPIAGTYAWRTYGADWVQLDAPRHLFLHTEASIGRLAERAGLVLERVEHDSTAFQFWGSEQYRQDIPLLSERSWSVSPRRSPFTPEQIAAYERQAARLNAAGDGDQACFYLRRPPGV